MYTLLCHHKARTMLNTCQLASAVLIAFSPHVSGERYPTLLRRNRAISMARGLQRGLYGSWISSRFGPALYVADSTRIPSIRGMPHFAELCSREYFRCLNELFPLLPEVPLGLE